MAHARATSKAVLKKRAAEGKDTSRISDRTCFMMDPDNKQVYYIQKVLPLTFPPNAPYSLDEEEEEEEDNDIDELYKQIEELKGWMYTNVQTQEIHQMKLDYIALRRQVDGLMGKIWCDRYGKDLVFMILHMNVVALQYYRPSLQLIFFIVNMYAQTRVPNFNPHYVAGAQKPSAVILPTQLEAHISDDPISWNHDDDQNGNMRIMGRGNKLSVSRKDDTARST